MTDVTAGQQAPAETPAAKAAVKVCALAYNAISRRNCDATLLEVGAIIQAAIDESLPKWEGLETAPKDGTKILLHDGQKCCVSWWGPDLMYPESAPYKWHKTLGFPLGWSSIPQIPQPPEDAR